MHAARSDDARLVDVMPSGSAPVRACRVAGSAVSSPNRVRHPSPSGFTLIELAVVAALIGVLATLGLIIAQSLIQRARAGATVTQMAFIRTGLLNLATNCEGLPLTGKSSGDPGLVSRPTGSTCWNGPYLVRWPTTTPFGKGTSFQYQGQKGTVAVLSAQSLTASDATALGAAVAPAFGGQAKLTSSKSVWTVTVNVGNFYK
jgi:prepilin-type N-terminal cleavage/methylation domain-containing protein